MESNEIEAKYITHVHTMLNTMKGLGEKMFELQVIEKICVHCQ